MLRFLCDYLDLVVICRCSSACAYFLFVVAVQRASHLVTEHPTGHLDGIEQDGKGGFFLTDWIAGTVLHICSHGDVTQVMKYETGSADLAYLPKKKLLILPHMKDNTLTAFKIAPIK